MKIGDTVISTAGRLATVEQVDGNDIYVRLLFADDDCWAPAGHWRLYSAQDKAEARAALDGYLRCAGVK